MPVLPKTLLERSLAPHDTLDLKDSKGIGKNAKESRNREGLAGGR
jgi:hypothetical protein